MRIGLKLATFLIFAFAIGCGHVEPSVGQDETTEPTRDCQSSISGYTLSYFHGTQHRIANIRLPSDYDCHRPTPIVYALHGWFGSADQMERSSELTHWADLNGYVIAYLQGTGVVNSWNAGKCCGEAKRKDVDDVGAFLAAGEAIEKGLNIDENKRFVVGASNGGAMVYRLACETKDYLAGGAVVAGFDGTTSCVDPDNFPVLHIHGDGDWIVPPEGRQLYNIQALSETTERWSGRYGCTSLEAKDWGLDCVHYDQCDGGTTYTACYAEGGHRWPGESHSRELIFRFFEGWN